MWRFVVEWPALIGRRQNLETLRRALRSDDTEVWRDQLREQLDGLERAVSAAAVLEWIERRNCIAARVMSRAMDLDQKFPDFPGSEVLTPGCVIERSQDSRFWPVEEAPLEPPPCEVGARAMRRHPFADSPDLPDGPVTGRLLAQVLDAAFLVDSGPEAAVMSVDVNSMPAAQSSMGSSPEGFGWAMTVRGPLLHRVVLDDAQADTAERWDVLAPTDWHFGPHGPVARGLEPLEGSVEPELVRFFVAGFDPCAAWSVVEANGKG